MPKEKRRLFFGKIMTLKDYKKKKDYLVCVDSDGCAMDTMDIKHYECFGPCMVDEWALGEWREPILARWNDINLYTMTRGINRFRGLAIALTEINEKYTKVEDLDALVRWTQESPELSNDALARAAEASPDHVSLAKALSWSRAVNDAIKKLPDESVRPYPLVSDALALAHERADVAIVSSANPGAVVDEWTRHGLIDHTDILLAQDAGSKAYCIGELLGKGYDPDRVLMCGDAPGDHDAAETNGVHFYPILVKHERESWQDFIDTVLDSFVDGGYDSLENEKKRAFRVNLGAEN